MTLEQPLSRGLAEAVSYAVTHGIVISTDTQAAVGTHISHAPFTYRPSQVDSHCYKNALSITKSLNRLVHAIAQDESYLCNTLSETAHADADFTGRLFKLLSTATSNPLNLSICRFDYFIHAEAGAGEQSRGLRMVEMNVIAASFAGLGTATSHMHRHLATHPAYDFEIDVKSLPSNDAIGGVCNGIHVAHTLFIERYTPSEKCVTVMIVQPGERNSYDQYVMQSILWSRHNLEMIRVSLPEIHAHATVDTAGSLHLRIPEIGKSVSVSVVYFRAGYVPEDYPSEMEWEARSLMEKSIAIKCPTVAMQLVGTKKIQQVLDSPGHVERFIPDKQEANAIRATFARQYSLSSTEGGDASAKMGIESPGEFVLKPQREGGGHNLYGNDIKTALLRMSSTERAGYVLMERIRPVEVKNIVIRDGVEQPVTLVSELGVFGVLVVNSGDVVENYDAGTLLRSKAASRDDGGVAAGVAVLDSVLLVDT